MCDKKSQLTFLVSISDAASEENTSFRNSVGLEPLPYFCTKINLQNAIIYMSQELQGLGLGCNFIDAGSQKLNLVSLVNACWEVTQLYRSSVRESTTLLDQRRRDASDLSHYQSNVKDLRASVEEKEREVCDAQERERQALTVNKALSSKVKSEKDEVRRLNSVLQTREGHHQHEIRKKETENNRLRERLHRLVSGDKLSDSRPVGITATNTLSRSNRSRAKWKTEATGVRHEEEMHRKALGRYEVWIGQLRDENDQLKEFLSTVTSQISKIVTRFTKNDHTLNFDGEMNSSMFSCDSLENPLFTLEFPTVREQVQQALEEHLKCIIQLIEDKNRGDHTHKDNMLLEQEVDELRAELARMKDKFICMISEDKGDSSERNAHVKLAGDDVYAEEYSVLERKKLDLELDKKSLQKERETFSEAAVRLNREKAAFEAEKVELLKRQFLQELPPALGTSVDMTSSSHESACSLSSGSLAELLIDSPQRNLGIPAITPPFTRMHLSRVSTPVVLGPTHLAKQQRDMYLDTSPRKSLYRLKSAPVSRASSVSRQDDMENQTLSDKEMGIRPHHSRPSTLERRRKPNSSLASLRYRSRSQSQSGLNVPKEDWLSDRGELLDLPNRVEGEFLLHSRKADNPDLKCQPYSFDKERLDQPPPVVYRDNKLRSSRLDTRTNSASKRLTIPQSSCEDRCYLRQVYSSDGIQDYKDMLDDNDNTNIKSLENDLLSLMARIGQHHGESVRIPLDEPPPYETVTPKVYRKTAVHALVSAPGSLCSSRRSSRDLTSTDEPSKRVHKKLMRK